MIEILEDILVCASVQVRIGLVFRTSNRPSRPVQP